MSEHLFLGLYLLPLLHVVISLTARSFLKTQWITFLASSAVQFFIAITSLTSLPEHPIRLQAGAWPLYHAINLQIDMLSCLLLSVSALVFLGGALLARKDIGLVAQKNRFWTLLSLLQLGVNGAFLTHDIFNLFVYYEVILISSFALLIVQNKPEQRKATSLYLSLNLVSSFVFLCAVGVLYSSIGNLHFDQIALRFSEISDREQVLISSLFFFSFATKAGIFPLYFWLPKAYEQLAPSLGGIFGGLLTKVGLYSMMRVFPLFHAPGSSFYEWILYLAIATMLLGVFAAYTRNELRSILSYHILSQVGYIAGGFALFGLSEDRAIQQLALAASIFYMIHHILVKSALFFSGSWNLSVFGSTQLGTQGGLRSLQITLSLLFVIPAMSLAGLPPFSGFWAKLGVLQASLEVSGLWYFFAAILAGLFTFFSMLKIWMQSYLGSAPSTQRAISQKWIYILGIAFLVVPSLWISLMPATLFEWSEEAAQSLLQSIALGGQP